MRVVGRLNVWRPASTNACVMQILGKRCQLKFFTRQTEVDKGRCWECGRRNQPRGWIHSRRSIWQMQQWSMDYAPFHLLGCHYPPQSQRMPSSFGVCSHLPFVRYGCCASSLADVQMHRRGRKLHNMHVVIYR